MYGKPQNWKDNKENRSTSQNPRVFQIASKPGNKTGENVSLNKDQLEQLYKLLTPSVATVSPPLGLNTSFLAQKCTFRTALSNTTEKLDPWIIDSSASNHMTGYASSFSTYNLDSRHIMVKFADGSLATVARTGTIVLNPHITLYDVLHVPKLACNLLSISKLTKDLDYSVQFLPSHCEFQEVTSGNRIGSAKELGGLYYFEDDNFENKQAFTASCASSSLFRKNEIMLWHFRLGHPNFQYLKHLFPSLFRNKDVFQCEICQLAKHQHSSYLPQSYKPSTPFTMIHSDIWGPSRIQSLTGKKMVHHIY